MSTIKISELPKFTVINANTSNTLFVGVDIPSAQTFQFSAGTLAAGLFANTELVVGNNRIVYDNTVAQFSGVSNNYLQINFQNFSTGTKASSDFVVSTGDSDNITKFVDLGISNGNYSDPVNYSAFSGYDAYLYNYGPTVSGAQGNLIIGAASANAKTIFIAGGVMQQNIVAWMTKTGLQLNTQSYITFSDNTTQTTAAASNAYSQAAFALANTTVTNQAAINLTQNTSITAAFTQANSAYGSQNVTGTYANSAYLAANGANANAITTGTYANSAYAQANSASLYANGAFIQANAAYGSQNVTGTYANSAYLAANNANANAITTGTYANSAYYTANSAGVYANGAFVQANAAYGSQNVTGTYANSAYLAANNANANAITSGVYANAAYVQANSAFVKANNALANTSGTFAGDLTITGNVITSGLINFTNTNFDPNVAFVQITGANTTYPASNANYMLQITGKANSTTRLVIDSFGAATYPVVVGRMARGSSASPAATSNNDIMMRIVGNGFTGTQFPGSSPTKIDFVASENFTDSARGTRIEFYNTPVGSNTIQRIASFNADSVTFTGRVEPQKGFVYTPIVYPGAQTAITIDHANTSVVRAQTSTGLVVTLSNLLAGKEVVAWITNTAGTNQTLTTGVSALNSTLNATTYNIPGTSTVFLRYMSIDGTVQNTFCSVTHA